MYRGAAGGQEFALKLLNNRMATDAEQQQILFKEISSMLRVEHCNVLRLYELLEGVELDGHTWAALVLELAPKGQLFDFLAATGAFDEITATSYLAQMASGLRACHDNDVMHRDLVRAFSIN